MVCFLFAGLALGILLGDKPLHLSITLGRENWLLGWVFVWCALALLLLSLRWDCPAATSASKPAPVKPPVPAPVIAAKPLAAKGRG